VGGQILAVRGWHMQIDLEQIHEASLKILRKTGVKFDHPEILKIIKKHGIQVSEQVAYFTGPQIMEWIQKAPSNFTIFARNPQYDVSVGEDITEFAAGYGATFVVDENGAKRNAHVEDYLNFLKLVHKSDHFSINGGLLVQPSDIASARPFPLLLYLTLLHSDKCLMGGSDGVTETQQTMDLLSICFGDRRHLIEKPRMVSIINSSSPLRFNRDSLDKLLIHARYGQPAMITAAVMGGTTGPITLAGTIAQANAETLAGIAVSQMIREGTPMVYGTQSTLADMQTGAYVSASPEHALCIRYGARLAKFYGLPCRGGGGKSDAHFVSAQSGFESMLTMLITCEEKMNIVVLSAGILDSAMAMSYEKFLLDLQIIAMAKRFVRGVHIDDETLALDAIHNVGPGGEFLTSNHTLKFCRYEKWPATIDSSAAGLMNNHKDMMHWLQKKKNAMLEAYRQPELADGVRSDMEKYLVDAGFDVALPTLI
jgi:trimethylamine--corrinoid protein Co-methyltransferase